MATKQQRIAEAVAASHKGWVSLTPNAAPPVEGEDGKIISYTTVTYKQLVNNVARNVSVALQVYDEGGPDEEADWGGTPPVLADGPIFTALVGFIESSIPFINDDYTITEFNEEKRFAVAQGRVAGTANDVGTGKVRFARVYINQEPDNSVIFRELVE